MATINLFAGNNILTRKLGGAWLACLKSEKGKSIGAIYSIDLVNEGLKPKLIKSWTRDLGKKDCSINLEAINPTLYSEFTTIAENEMKKKASNGMGFFKKMMLDQSKNKGIKLTEPLNIDLDF